MLQIYLLSIILNAASGLVLLTGLSKEKLEAVRTVFEKAAIRSGLGGATALVGLLKFFVRAPLDSVALAGDLLPALAGLTTGTALLADVYMTRHAETETAGRLQKVMKIVRLPLGVLGLGAAALHFVMPQATLF